MKRNNGIIYAVLGIISIFLLWLWYYLDLNAIDDPLDLVISIIWWVMGAVAIFAIVEAEKRRKRAIRTVYLAEKEMYNSEVGRILITEPEKCIDTLATLIQDLKYDFTKNDFPDAEEFSPHCLIRTEKLNDDEWEGEVVNIETKQQVRFENREELVSAIASHMF